jgi:UDP-2-acetamido-3-amino-2,3-dideoxy-glucuronate N-acetyltransferase
VSERLPRVAVIGAGYWGQNLVRNFSALGALTVVCDADEDRLRAMTSDAGGCRGYRDVAAVLADPTIEAVAIATPAETHTTIVRAALLADKDVFVEKPLSLAVSDASDLVELAAHRQRVLMVGHLLWYHPAVLQLKALVDDGALGRLQYIYSTRVNLGRIRREENILWSFAPHDISVILGLLGELPDDVQAQGGSYLHPKIADVTVSLLSFPSGVKAHIFVSWLHPFKEQKLVLVGDRQMAVFDDLEKDHKLLLYPHSVGWRRQVPVVHRAEGRPVPVSVTEPLREECLHFLQCVRTRERPRTDGHEGLRVLRVLERCEQALAGPRVPRAPARTPRAFTAHESAFIDDDVEIGEGTTIWHVSHVLRGSRVGRECRIGQNVVIGPNVTIGDGVKIQNNVSVYEGVTLEDHVFCGPSMVFTNVYNPRSQIRRMNELRRTLVRRGATLGANSTVLCGVTIGEYAFVGAGAVVLRDVPDFGLVVGNPGRVIGWMCVCGHRITMGAADEGQCAECSRKYRHKHGGLTLR